MKTYSLFDSPLRVYGVPLFEKHGRLERLPEELIEQLPHLSHLGRRCIGGRVELKTDSPRFTVKMSLKTLSIDQGMSLYSSQAVHVLVGERGDCRHIGIVNPPNYDTKVVERSFEKSSELEQITLYFPRNEQVENIEIFVEDSAEVCAPTPYKYQKPVVFYGSSITEGGCCCNVSNAYSAMLSRWLDFDFYNLGFSGCAKGEPVMADYINTFDMSVFVYDYDHNAPSVEYLRETHEPFFKRIRSVHPKVPVIMMSQPSQRYTDMRRARREVIRETYLAAKEAGDDNVYFIDGESFYAGPDGSLCSFDDCHPNDLGFYFMAKRIRPVLEEALKKSAAENA